jgi:hypothetical protein
MRRLRNAFVARLVSLIVFGVATPAVWLAGGPDNALRFDAIPQVAHGEDKIEPRYLVIAERHVDKPGAIAQVQLK